MEVRDVIVIGLGPGRSGTASLAHFLNRQHRALVFHEMNPRCMHYRLTRAPVRNTIEEFELVLKGGDASQITMDLTLSQNQEIHADLSENPD